MTLMANYWASKNQEITILSFEAGERPPFFELDHRVQYRPLNIAGESSGIISGFKNNRRRIGVLRAAISETDPDCVISFIDQTNILTLLATRRLNVPTIVEEHIHLESHSLPGIWRILRAITYRRATRIVVLTERGRTGFSSGLQKKITVVPNPVVPAKRNRFGHERLAPGPMVVAIGRLTRQKGFDLLIRAFAIHAARHQDWTLTIIGEGPLRRELEQLSDSLDLNGRINFPGAVRSVEDYFNLADLFVMSSRYEGFPMALCEAMASGLPVICTDCPTGPREIVRNNVDGILVPNEDLETLAAAMDRLMTSESERTKLAQRAPEITSRFGLETVMAIWDRLLSETVKRA